VGYVLSRNGARKLLAKEKLFRQIDEDFKHPWEFGLDIWSLTPNLVTENSRALGGSLLEAERLAIKRTHRSFVISMKGNYLTVRRKLLGLCYTLSNERRETPPVARCESTVNSTSIADRVEQLT